MIVINRSDKFQRTCLMFAVGSEEICRFLIQQGVSVHAVDYRGNTALHYAIQEGFLDSVKLLMEHGADPSLCNRYGDDALQTAALSGKPGMVEFLIQEMQPTPQKRADAYELLAATMTIYKGSHTSAEHALPYWRKSVTVRMNESAEDGEDDYDDDDDDETAFVSSFAIEAKDFDTLRHIDQMIMKAFVTIKRILGLGHPQTISALVDCANDHHGCSPSVLLSKLALRNFLVWPHTLANLDRIVHRIGREQLSYWYRGIDFVDAADMLGSMIEKLAKITAYLAECPAEQRKEQDHLPNVAINLVQMCCVTSTEADTSTIHQLVRSLIQARLRTSNGATLLHLAASRAIHNVPKSGLIEALLNAGTAVNEVDSADNTPLHEAVFSRPDMNNKKMVDDREKMIKVLLDHGAHVDVANAKREIAADHLPDRVDVFDHVSLQCLAARAIRAHKLPYRGILSERIADFADHH